MLKEYTFEDSQLKKIWDELYKENTFLFSYSSREYNEYIAKYMRLKPKTRFQKKDFLVYYDEQDIMQEKPLMLIPAYIKKVLYIYSEKTLAVQAI